MSAFTGGGSGGRPFAMSGVIVALQIVKANGHVMTYMIKPMPFGVGDRLGIGCVGSDVMLTATEKGSIANGYVPTSVLEEHVRFMVLEE